MSGEMFSHILDHKVRDYLQVNLNQLFTNFIWGAYIVRERQGKQASVDSPCKVPQA